MEYLHSLREQIPTEIDFDSTINFPIINDNDIIDIYYLESPLQVLGDVIKRSDLFSYKLFETNANHSGVGFVYRKNNIEFALDYSAYNFMDVFIPKINTDAKDSLVWNNNTHITYHHYIDRDYWRKSTYIGFISGNMLKQIKEWILNTFIPNNYMYVLFNVYLKNGKTYTDSVNNMFNNSEYLRRSICDTFCLELFDFIDKKGGNISYITPPFEAISAIFVENDQSIEILDYNNEKDRSEIIGYYVTLEKTLSDVINNVKSDIENVVTDLQKSNGKYKNILKNITNDYFTIGNIIKGLNLNTMILYSYGSKGNTNKSNTYYKLNLTNSENIMPIFMNYVESPLLRNTIILDVNKNQVQKQYVSDKVVSNKFNLGFNLGFKLLVLLIIVLVFVIYYRFLYNRK